MADQSQRSIFRILTTMQNTVQGINSNPQGSSALSQQESSKSGWLKKQGGIVKSWHNRWFTLKGDQLYYYSNQDDSKQPLGTIFLPGNKVIELPKNPNEPDKYLFEVVPGGDRSRMTVTHDTYPICAASDEERKAWVLAVKKVMFSYKGGAIFGQSLEETMAYENTISKRKVPEIVELCVEFLLQNGLDVEGIFRLPGRSSVIKKLREEYDCGERPEFSLPELDIHSIASLLKLYLRELPSPIIPVTSYEAVMKICTRDFHQNPDSAMDALSQILLKLPRHQYNLLQYLCTFLFEVSKNCQENKMTVMNLATVFVQNNIIQPEDNDAVLLMGTSNGRTQVAFLLVTYCEKLFKLDYNEQGASIAVENLLDIGDSDRAFVSDTGVYREKQTASALLDADQGDNLPCPLAPVQAPTEPDKGPGNDESDVAVGDENNFEVSNYVEFQGVETLETSSSDDRSSDPLYDTVADDREAPVLRRPTRPAPTPRARGGIDRVVLGLSEGVAGDRRSVLGSVRRPVRAPPPPPASRPERSSNNSIPGGGETANEEHTCIDPLLDRDLEDLDKNELISHVKELRDELRKRRLETQSLKSSQDTTKEQHKQQVVELSKRIHDEQTATANAVQRIMQLQTELQQYTLKHGNLA